MSSPENDKSNVESKSQPPPPPPVTPITPLPPPPGAAATVKLEAGGRAGGTSDIRFRSITRRWRRDDMLRKGSFCIRGLSFLFCLISFLVMATDKHGDWKDFDKYPEFRYVLAIAVLSTFYTGSQALRYLFELSTGRQLLAQQNSALVDFLGDQIASYLLISSTSSAIPMTNRLREGEINIFIDALFASLTMSLLAFIALSLSAIISGYKLCTVSYI